MHRFDTPQEARAWCADERSAGRTLGFVPTMGALHAGHRALVERAVAECDRAVVSVFVNPLQFDDPADLERYPRDFAGDADSLEPLGCSMVFRGTLEQFFPESEGGEVARTEPGTCAEGLEGAHRPGHFAGVATIVERLFEVVEPTTAYFGAKDYQQSLVVGELARRRGRPRIEVCATVREADGLALSSRNLLLSPEARTRALVLFRALEQARSAWQGGERFAAPLAAAMEEHLDADELELEYAAVRDPEAWTAEAPDGPLEQARALVAARIGGVRLIDNCALHGDAHG